MPDEPVHARDPDGGEQPADRGGDEADEERHDHGDGEAEVGVEAEGNEGHAGDQEDDRHAGEENGEGDLVGRLLPLRPLDEADHPVEERLARVGPDPDHDAVGEDLRAPGDRRAVAAALADHGGRLAGDGRLVHGRDALDHLAVAGDDLAHLHHHHVALAQRGGGDALLAPGGELAGHRLLPQPAEGGGLGLAPALGQGLREVREEDREPEPEGHVPREPGGCGARRAQDHVVQPDERGEDAPDLHHEHDRVLHHRPRVELAHAVEERGAEEVSFPGGHGADVSCRSWLRTPFRTA